MDAPEIIVGLDIGTTKIACLVGRKTDHGKIEILGIGKAPSLGVTRGVVSNIEKTVQSIRAAVEEAESKSGIEIKVVNVGIAGQHIKSLQHRGMITRDSIDEEISQKDVDELGIKLTSWRLSKTCLSHIIDSVLFPIRFISLFASKTR